MSQLNLLPQKQRNLLGNAPIEALTESERDPDVYAGMFLFHIKVGERFHLGSNNHWTCEKITPNQIVICSDEKVKVSIKHHGPFGATLKYRQTDGRNDLGRGQCVVNGFFTGKPSVAKTTKAQLEFNNFWRELVAFINLCKTSDSRFLDENMEFVLSVLGREEE